MSEIKNNNLEFILSKQVIEKDVPDEILKLKAFNRTTWDFGLKMYFYGVITGKQIERSKRKHKSEISILREDIISNLKSIYNFKTLKHIKKYCEVFANENK
ncbi:hypothetical protein [Clostridioides sp. ZZV15-6598]|uniref:hypothetical protein n=1 Tax=Clostridioides sp. ZZV15-6598 TaxID=2811501 RepID=UPI001D125B50|nr:hypothetical protein [Clostridioides sp. ZZV15-6598]MDV9712520.1 hypothetical protein [Clostridioides difficile]